MSQDNKQSLIQYYHWLRMYGYNDSHSGNASIRQEETFCVTPTGACADTLLEEELKCGNLTSPPPEGASLDAELHRQVYLNNPSAMAVLHSHAPHLVALTMGGEDFVPQDFEGQYYFGIIRVVDLPYDRIIQEAPVAVSEMLKELPLAVVRGHGVYAQGKDLNQAYKWICSAELSARTAWIAAQYPTG
jgi:L-fuculose-phosphate aldolase